MAQATDTGWEFQISYISSHRVPTKLELIVVSKNQQSEKQEAINVYV